MILDEDDQEATDFSTYIMNELLLEVADPVQQIIIAAANVPWNHQGLWERWLKHINLPLSATQAIRSQLPTKTAGDRAQRFVIVPVLREVLAQLGMAAVQSASIQELLGIALSWYIDQGELKAASSLAFQSGLQRQFLREIKPVCEEFAEKEDWQAIARLAEKVGDTILAEDPDLLLWYMLGCYERDGKLKLSHVQQDALKTWCASDDSLLSGRAHLINAWNAYAIDQIDDAIRKANRAFNAMPAAARKERTWASGFVAASEMLRGNREIAQKWSTIAISEFSQVSGSQRWWHNTVGVAQISWLCVAGMLDHSYELATRHLRRREADGQSELMGYQIAKALIDTERLRFDRAAELLEQAARIPDPSGSQLHSLLMAQANLAYARGDFELAWDTLSHPDAPFEERMEQISRETHLRAQIALATGDVSVADLMMGSAVQDDGYWPRAFGDVHPRLIRSLIASARGRVDDAIAQATSTAHEATRRRHTHYAVTANATLAYIYHQHGYTQYLNLAIDAAVEAAKQYGFQQAFTIMGIDVRELRVQDVQHPIYVNGSSVNDGGPALTPRELEVLTIAAQTRSNKEIAERMYLSVSTVKNHLGSAYDKLGVNSRRKAIRTAVAAGIIELPETEEL